MIAKKGRDEWKEEEAASI